MKRCLILMFLFLVLLVGCTPTAEIAPTPPLSTENSLAPKPIDFRDFQRRVNDERRKAIEQGKPIDVSPYTPDISEQTNAFTTEEVAQLNVFRERRTVTAEEAREDIETCFMLLKTTYGAYDYFGGDATFLPVKATVLREIDGKTEVTAEVLDDVLNHNLAPLLVDGHFQMGSGAMSEVHTQYMYYVPDLYLEDSTGLDPDYVKPTIGPDGAITHCFAAISRDGADLPGVLAGRTLHWVRAEADASNQAGYGVTQAKGVTVMTCDTANSQSEAANSLERMAKAGADYRDLPLFVLDLRGNSGGDQSYGDGWFTGFAGRPPEYRHTMALKRSQLAVSRGVAPEEQLGTWSVSEEAGAWVEREGQVFVLTDKTVASSGEGFLMNMRTVGNLITVGGPTAGCALTPACLDFYLPNSSVGLYFGTGIWFAEDAAGKEGVGYLPDLWVNPPQAQDAVLRLIEHYGLVEQ